MRGTRAVCSLAALAFLLLPAFAHPDHDGPPGSRFLRGSRDGRLWVPFSAYPLDRPNRWRFVARSEAEWRAIAEEIHVDADRFAAFDFDRRMVVGLVDIVCVGVPDAPIATEVLGAVLGRSGRMTVRWRYAYVDDLFGFEGFPECSRTCLVWSFPRSDGRVRFRRQPARYFNLDLR